MERTVKVTGLAASTTKELLSNFFTFHGKIEECVVSGDGCVGYIQFNNAAAAKSALLFDKASFLNETISVQLTDDPVTSGGASEPTAPSPSTPSGSSPTTKRLSAAVEHPVNARSSTAGDASEPDAVVVERAASPCDDNEEFERVEAAEADDSGEEACATGSTKSPPAAAASPSPPAAAGAGAGAFACFAELSKEPLNDPRAVLAVTLASFLTLAIW